MKKIYLLALVAIFNVSILKAQSVAKFDDLNLASGKFWNGSDQSGSFKSSGITFHNSYNKDWGSWSGFAYSNMTDVTTAGYENQYSAITGKGFAGSSNYAVCYPSPSAEAEFSSVTKISGFYITNSTYAYLSMKNGDMFSKKFGGATGNDPDFFRLMIEALNNEGKPVDTVYFYLADFRFADNSKDYILNKWTWVDLSQLKEAKKLRFSMTSSDNSWGYMNTPGYFCMDDLNGEKPFDYQPVTFASFENLNLGNQGYYNGSDQSGSFFSGNFRFWNSYNKEWGTWEGFAASNKTDKTTPGWGNQYSAITGKGVAGTPSYAVVYASPKATVTFKDTTLSGMYVTNSTYAYWSMKNGDSFSKKFGGETGKDDDYLILNIEGFNSDNISTGKIEFFLADFGYTNSLNDYILDTWKWVNLAKLGRISKLEFSLRSSDNGNWGMNTPAYFCLDNLNHEISTSVNELEQNQLSVFPNPFNDRIVVSGINGITQATLTDISGKIIGQYTVTNNHSISGLDQLKAGVYFLKVIEDKNQTVTKLIKK
ncbi:MAG: DUF4465 domain-containing protein [Prolixibacteraceae bacterium]|nr:DUF4465 domain-containing protein [Prolixibacteraceae bacterium]